MRALQDRRSARRNDGNRSARDRSNFARRRSSRCRNRSRPARNFLTGGNRIKRAGFFYEPTVLTDIPRDSPAFSEEVFGPVASFFRVRDADEAIEIANDTLFGLGRERVDERSRANRNSSPPNSKPEWFSSTAWSPPIRGLPFGGVKRSGFGRELGAEGIREFVNIKTVVVA